MRFISFMVGLSLASCGLMSFFLSGLRMEVFGGMLAPLTVGVVTILMVKKIYLKEPRKLTVFMAKAFIGKMIIYAVYLVAMVKVYSFQPAALVVSFASYYGVLHIVEALYFRRLFASAMQVELKENL